MQISPDMFIISNFQISIFIFNKHHHQKQSVYLHREEINTNCLIFLFPPSSFLLSNFLDLILGPMTDQCVGCSTVLETHD